MNNEEVKKLHEPLFHIEKRGGVSKKKAWGIRGIGILVAVVIVSILAAIMLQADPFTFFGKMFEGAFGTTNRIWNMLRDTAILLGFALAIVPAFRMRFWNLGANGQVLMGAFAFTVCMFYLYGKIPLGVLVPLMVISSVAAGMLWAAIPAVFKAFFNTNESLFTLMMNYIAESLVTFTITVWVPNGSGSLPPIIPGGLKLFDNAYILPILIIALLTVGMFFYLRISKQGYELTVVGESENTARYIGINVKKVIIRTLAISGAICGLVGFLLSGCMSGTINPQIHSGYGFTAIIVTWLAQFNPLVMAGVAFLVIFVNRGMKSGIKPAFGLTTEAFANIVTGIIFFCVLAFEFFIVYKFKYRSDVEEKMNAFKAKFKKKSAAKVATEATSDGVVASESASEAAEKANGAGDAENGENAAEKATEEVNKEEE